MFRVTVITLLWLFVQLSHPFPFDIVASTGKNLEFYYKGTITHTEVIPSAHEISSVTYDPVNYKLLFTDSSGSTESISSFDLSNRQIQPLFTRNINHYTKVVYDPVAQVLFWRAGYSIYSFPLNPASSNKTVDGNLLITLDHLCTDIAVDSCGGYIYWITDEEIERSRLDGSEREVLIDSTVYMRRSLAIDQQTQKMYWIETTRSDDNQVSIKSANFNGKNRTTIYIVRNVSAAHSLAVSKDFIYWQNYQQEGIWQLPKNQTQLTATKLHSMSKSICGACHLIAANYTIKEQIQGIKSCEALQRLIPHDSKSEFTVSICQNYCFQGECSVSAKEQPTCSCKAGYSGERCEVNACHEYCLHGGVCSINEKNIRVCQCTSGYEGERCEVSICKDYCFYGTCSVDAEGQPKCSCTAGYSGERCEENACHKHCLNGGVCSLNEEDEPACQCTADYDGVRCELSANKDNSCDACNSGEGKVSACHQFCLNNGICSLNEASQPVCQCTADYEGERCEVPVNKDFCFQAACSVSAEGQPKVTVTLGKGVQSTCV